MLQSANKLISCKNIVTSLYYIENSGQKAMEKIKKEIDKSIELLKEEIHKNFSKDNYLRITQNAVELLRRSEEIGYLNGKYGALNIFGNAAFILCDYEKALEYFLESLRLAEMASNKKNMSFAMNNIGIIFFRLKKFDKALDYYMRALELKLKTEDKPAISTAYNNIGLVYSNLKEYDKALDYFNMSLRLDEETGNKYAISRELNNIGLVWKNKGDTAKALECFLGSYEISVQAEYNKGKATALSNISNYYFDRGDYSLALEKALEGEMIANAIHSNNHLMNFYGQIAESYEKKNMPVQALEYYKKLFTLKDKIFSDKSQNKIFEMEIRYEIEKKAKESELYKLKSEELTLINTTKDKFFRIIHHDLLNPFTAIYSTAGFLSQYYDKIDEEKRKHYIEMILNSSERLIKLMDNLFAWVKTQTGEIDYNPENIGLREIVSHNVELLSGNICAKEIIVELKIPKTCSAHADKNMVDLIVRNLLANSIKFTFDKGKISITGKNLEKTVCLSFKDTGMGIEKHNLKRLFKLSETFTSPGTKDEKGTGLGLILVKEFLDKNNGKISVESKPGKGSKFTIELPKYI